MPRSMADRVVERRPDDGRVRLAASELGSVAHEVALAEGLQPDVGRQVRAIVELIVAVPAVERRVVGELGLSH